MLLTGPKSLDIRLRPPEIPSPPAFRAGVRPGLPLPPSPDREEGGLRISFHEDERELRGSRHSLARSCKEPSQSHPTQTLCVFLSY